MSLESNKKLSKAKTPIDIINRIERKLNKLNFTNFSIKLLCSDTFSITYKNGDIERYLAPEPYSSYETLTQYESRIHRDIKQFYKLMKKYEK